MFWAWYYQTQNNSTDISSWRPSIVSLVLHWFLVQVSSLKDPGIRSIHHHPSCLVTEAVTRCSSTNHGTSGRVARSQVARHHPVTPAPRLPWCHCPFTAFSACTLVNPTFMVAPVSPRSPRWCCRECSARSAAPLYVDTRRSGDGSEMRTPPQPGTNTGHRPHGQLGSPAYRPHTVLFQQTTGKEHEWICKSCGESWFVDCRIWKLLDEDEKWQCFLLCFLSFISLQGLPPKMIDFFDSHSTSSCG